MQPGKAGGRRSRALRIGGGALAVAADSMQGLRARAKPSGEKRAGVAQLKPLAPAGFEA
jgi:hypothetical protein